MKKKHLKLFIAIISLASLVVGGFGSYTYAATCGTDADGNPIKTSTIDCSDVEEQDTNGDGVVDSNDIGSTGVWKLLITVINWLTVGVGIAVVGGITFGAIRYISSDGNSSQAQEGMSIITNAIIGLVLYLFMYAIINFLVPGGLFN